MTSVIVILQLSVIGNKTIEKLKAITLQPMVVGNNVLKKSLIDSSVISQLDSFAKTIMNN